MIFVRLLIANEFFFAFPFLIGIGLLDVCRRFLRFLVPSLKPT